MSEFVHKTVMLNEAVEALNIEHGKLYIDGTAGGGGHSLEIAKALSPEGRLLMFDADPEAIEASTKRLAEYKNIVTIIRSNYSQIPEVLNEMGIEEIDGGVLFDLGTSFHQLTSAERGFSFSSEARLDMRMNPDLELDAYEVVNKWPEKDLHRIFSEYGEEHFSGRIARNIAEQRQIKPIETTKELADLIVRCTPNIRNKKSKQKVHPATKVFQAIRIAVNNELEIIDETLRNVIPLLGKNARIVVISFHSLEDKVVKNVFRHYSQKCTCPPNKPICDCGPPMLKLLTRKPVPPSEEEIKENPPSRSAKMRVAMKIN